MEGKTQQTAAAMAGMSERSARKWQRGSLPSENKQERRWRTRPDPFDGVWEEEILPLLQGEGAGRLRAAGLPIEDLDLLIGATAIYHELVLLTGNHDHFSRMEGSSYSGKGSRHGHRASQT